MRPMPKAWWVIFEQIRDDCVSQQEAEDAAGRIYYALTAEDYFKQKAHVEVFSGE